MKFLDRIRKEKSCNDELNILDIDNNIFFSLDGYISLYVKIIPISFEYLSINEKERIIKRLTNELSGEREIIKIIVMSLPISTAEINDYIDDKRNKTKSAFKRRKLLEQIQEIKNISYNGEMVEKEIVIQLFKKGGVNEVNELYKRGKELLVKLQNAGLSAFILDKRGILQFFNSFLNMRFKNDNFNFIGSDVESE